MRTLVVLHMPMGLDAFISIIGAITKHYPDAVLGDPDDKNRVVVEVADDPGADA